MKKASQKKQVVLAVSETAGGGGKGDSVFREGKEKEGLKTLMVTIETEMLKTKSHKKTCIHTHTHTHPHTEMYIHDPKKNKQKKNAHGPAHSHRQDRRGCDG